MRVYSDCPLIAPHHSPVVLIKLVMQIGATHTIVVPSPHIRARNLNSPKRPVGVLLHLPLYHGLRRGES